MEEKKAGVIDYNGYYAPGSGFLINQKNKKIRFMVIFIGISLIISIMIGAAVREMKWNFSPTQYRESYEHSADINSNISKINLSIENIAGEIYIDMELDNPDALFEITTDVFTNDNGITRYLESTWAIDIINNETYSLKFKDNTGYSDIRNTEILFKHHISFQKNIIFEKFSLSSTSGPSSLNLENITIYNPSIDSTSGSISISANNINITNSDFKTASGSILFDVSKSTIMDTFELSSTSGLLDVKIVDTLLDIDKISLDIVSGGLDFISYRNIFSRDVLLLVEITSGSVEFDWIQNVLNSTVKVDMNTISGNISGDITIDTSITTTFNNNYEEENDIPDDHLGNTGTIDFNFEVTSGSIDVNLFS